MDIFAPLKFSMEIFAPLNLLSYPLLAPKKFRRPKIFHTPYFHKNFHIPLFVTERLVSKMAPTEKTLDLLNAKAAKPAGWGQLNFFQTFQEGAAFFRHSPYLKNAPINGLSAK